MATVKELLKRRAGISIDLPSPPAARKQELASSAKNRNQGYQTQVVLKPPASTPLKPPVKTPTTFSGRLSGHGMNLGAASNDYYASKNADAARRTKAGIQSIGYSMAGSLPALLETLDQSNKDYEANRTNLPHQRAKAEAGKVNSYAMSKLVAETGNITEKHQEYLDKMAKADALAIKTPVDQSLFGQRMMAKSRAKQGAATQDLNAVDAFLANTAISMGANLPAIGVGMANPAIGLGMMGTQAAAQKTTELNERGYAPSEALGRGLLSGGIEAATEKLPLDSLVSIVKGSAGKNALKNILRQSGMEATEEAVAYVANYVADAAANDPEAQFSLQEMALSALGGAVSGVAFATGGTAVRGAINLKNEPGLPHMDSAPTTQGTENPMLPRAKEPMLSNLKAAKEANNQSKGIEVDVQPADSNLYSPMQKTIQEYRDSVDGGLVDYVKNVRSNPGSKELYRVGTVSPRAASDLSDLLGFDTNGFNEILNSATVKHIDNRHGIGGKQDHSMADVNDIARIKYVLDNYDNVVKDPTSSKAFSNSDGRAAAKVVYSKRVNGTYYVVEAVPNSKAKSVHIVSAYKTKAAPQAPLTKAVGSTSDNAPVNAAFSNPTVPQKIQSVNSQSMQETLDYTQAPNDSEFGQNTVGAAQHNPNSYSSIQNEYGTIEPGENPTRTVDVPKKTPQGKTRRFTRTMMESEAIPDSMIGDFEEAIVNGTFAYAPISDRAALSHAERVIRNDGFDGALKGWEAVTNSKRQASKNDIVLGEMLLNQAANAGDAELAMKLAAELAAEGTRAGQNVQALRLLKRMKPDGQLYYLQKSVQKVNADLLDRLKLKAPNVKIDGALAQELLSAKNQKEIDIATDKIMQNIADQIPPNWVDKWNAWRYLSMLGNPRTHIRNIIGNATFVPAVKLKNLIGTAMEKSLPRSERTKAVLTRKDKVLKDFARADFENVRAEITSGGKLNPSDAIRDKQTIFKTKPLESARKGNLNALEAEDAFFLRLHYTSSLAQVVKVRGYTAEFLKSGTKEANSALEEARNYAIQEAQKATYRDASKAANAINNFKRSGPVQSVVGEGLMPFTKTPINILKRGVEYSPMGLINGTKAALVDVKSGKVTASQAIDKLASGLSGTAIVALGAWLASLDLLSGGDSDDKKESMFDRLQGLQNYALKIGDYTYTLDWAAPSSLPLFVGVEIYNISQGEGVGASLSNILDGLSKISEPMVEMSMLQGIDSAFKAISYGENPLTAFLIETSSGYFGQGVPTLAGQVARTIDGTRRTRYVDKNEGLPPDFIQKFAQKQQAKLPGASKAMLPYVDAWGGTQENGTLPGRAVQNFLSPGYVSKNKTEAVDVELDRLYKSTGEGKVLPSNAKQFMYFDGETKRFTAEEYFDYAVERGKVAHDALKALVASQTYKGLSDDERVSVVSSIYDYANAVAKTKVSDYELSKQMAGAKKAQEDGVPVGNYFIAYHAQKDVEGDPDESGGTISGTETVNKRRAIDASMRGASFNQRDTVYKAFNVGLSETAEKKWEVPSVKKAVGSREKYYKIQELISTIKADKDEFGNSISGTAKPKEIEAISKQLGISKKQAGNIYNELVVFKHSISEMSSEEQRDWQAFKEVNMSEAKYIKYTNEMRIVSGLKDGKGKTISGSLKRNRYNRLLQLGMSSAQARYFLSVRFGYKW